MTTWKDDNKWVQVDCRPTHASFRNHSFFYNDTKIDISDWSLNDHFKMYNWIIENDDEMGWSTINLNVFIS